MPPNLGLVHIRTNEEEKCPLMPTAEQFVLDAYSKGGLCAMPSHQDPGSLLGKMTHICSTLFYHRQSPLLININWPFHKIKPNIFIKNAKINFLNYIPPPNSKYTTNFEV